MVRMKMKVDEKIIELLEEGDRVLYEAMIDVIDNNFSLRQAARKHELTAAELSIAIKTARLLEILEDLRANKCP